ncbi:MAG: tripartite tricarboxylate transporter substrate binding protein [Casimicrobiaceae bacterium]
MLAIAARCSTIIVWLMLAVAGQAAAQDYPSKAVRLVDPYVPGGSTGVVSRLLAQKFQELTKQPMVVDNRPGAGSNIGSDIVAKSAPDGYTLLLGTSSLAINPALYKTMSFNPTKDLVPIVVLIRAPNVLAVNASLPVKNVTELVEYARANPGKLNYGSSGNGATNHMGAELFKSLAKVDMVHVPFKGGGDALTALLGGQINVLFNPASTLIPHEASGKIRLLAVGSNTPVEGLNLPTVASSLPGFESGVWFGLFAPSGTPPAIVSKLNADLNTILKDKQVADALNKAGLTPVGGTSTAMRDVLANDTTRWADVVRTAGLKIE